MSDTSGPIVRSESPGDLAAIREVHRIAFGRQDEADLVDALRSNQAVLGSFVAILDAQIAGHVLFSRMWIEATSGPIETVALAPVAVLPGYQRRGIGGCLIRHGIDALRGQSERVMLVLGEPGYYCRFGFSTEKASNLISQFPREAYMALELSAGALAGIRGKVRYAAAFGLGD